LARYLLNLWNGINITRRIYQTNKELKPLIEFQLSIIN
jgi:TetR/AcrR family transcriptional regulator, transcriptional repressor for nem operon